MSLFCRSLPRLSQMSQIGSDAVTGATLDHSSIPFLHAAKARVYSREGVGAAGAPSGLAWPSVLPLAFCLPLPHPPRAGSPSLGPAPGTVRPQSPHFGPGVEKSIIIRKTPCHVSVSMQRGLHGLSFCASLSPLLRWGHLRAWKEVPLAPASSPPLSELLAVLWRYLLNTAFPVANGTAGGGGVTGAGYIEKQRRARGASHETTHTPLRVIADPEATPQAGVPSYFDTAALRTCVRKKPPFVFSMTCW